MDSFYFNCRGCRVKVTPAPVPDPPGAWWYFYQVLGAGRIRALGRTFHAPDTPRAEIEEHFAMAYGPDLLGAAHG